MLSVQCPKCGGTVRFDEDHVATFCSFCGTHLPDMTDYVKQAVNLGIDQKRHNMEIEKIEKDIERQKILESVEKSRNREINSSMLKRLIIMLPCIVLMFFFFYIIFKLISM